VLSIFNHRSLVASSSSPLRYNGATRSFHWTSSVHALFDSHSVTSKHIGQAVLSDQNNIQIKFVTFKLTWKLQYRGWWRRATSRLCLTLRHCSDPSCKRKPAGLELLKDRAVAMHAEQELLTKPTLALTWQWVAVKNRLRRAISRRMIGGLQTDRPPRPSFGRLSRAAEGLQTCEAERLLATVNQGKQLFKTGIALVQFPLLKMCQPVPSPAVCAFYKNSPIHNGISTPSHQKRSVSRSSLIIPGCHKPSADIIRLWCLFEWQLNISSMLLLQVNQQQQQQQQQKIQDSADKIPLTKLGSGFVFESFVRRSSNHLSQ